MEFCCAVTGAKLELAGAASAACTRSGVHASAATAASTSAGNDASAATSSAAEMGTNAEPLPKKMSTNFTIRKQFRFFFACT